MLLLVAIVVANVLAVSLLHVAYLLVTTQQWQIQNEAFRANAFPSTQFYFQVTATCMYGTIYYEVHTKL